MIESSKNVNSNHEPKGFYRYKKEQLDFVNVIKKDEIDKKTIEEQISYFSMYKDDNKTKFRPSFA